VRAFERDVVEFFVLDQHVLPFLDLITLDAILLIDRIAGVRVHDLIVDAVAGLAVDDVETDALAGAGGGIKRHRAGH
jgi:hypothetical protein